MGSCTEQQQVLEAAVMVAEAKAKALEGAWLPPWVAASVALALAQAQKLAKQYTVQVLPPALLLLCVDPDTWYFIVDTVACLPYPVNFVAGGS